MPVKISGVIVSSDWKEVYDWFGMTATCPRDVANAIANAVGDIVVDINSGGGDVFAGSEIYTMLKSHPSRIIVNVQSLAASAASVIACAGDIVNISPTAQIMIHNVSSYAAGDYRDMQHQADVLKTLNESIAHAYVLKTGKSSEELQAMMDSETWLTAKKAVELGFADSIMFEKTQLVASAYANVLPLEVLEKTKNLISQQKQNEALAESERLGLLILKKVEE